MMRKILRHDSKGRLTATTNAVAAAREGNRLPRLLEVKREILKEGEDFHLCAKPANQNDFQKQGGNTHQQKTTHGERLR
jgi:hypothetical protein